MFDNIRLVPDVVSTVESRSLVSLKTRLGEYDLKLPVLGSPMVDVCNVHMCETLDCYGGLGFLHRFQTIQEQVTQYNNTTFCGCAIGINQIDRFHALYRAGCNLFIIDSANGAHINVEKTIQSCLQNGNTAQFIVGNVAHWRTFEWCARLPNVVGVRVGIGGGRGCQTAAKTGILSHTFDLLCACRSAKERTGINAAIIWDGGIRSEADICKALTGADLVMLGSMIAQASDSPAKVQAGKKIYHGSASEHIQGLYKEPKYIEGKRVELESSKTLNIILQNIEEGLQSCLSYFDSKTLGEFRNKVRWESGE